MTTSSWPWAEMLASAISGGGLTKALDWMSSRGQSKAYTMGAVDHAVQTAMGLVTERLEHVEEQHNECQAKLEDVRNDLARARAEIARMMSGPVARWGDKAPE